MNVSVSAGNSTHVADFLISPANIPGCDVILGIPFLTYANAELAYSPVKTCTFPAAGR